MKLPWEMTKPQFKAFLACMMCAAMATFTMVMVSSAVKQISKSYSVSYLDGIWIAECSALTAIVFSVISADISDKFGKRRILVLGMLLLVVSSIFAAFAPDFTTLLISRVISGAGSAMVFSSNVSILTDLCKKEYIPEVMSFNHSATSIGGACGPLFGYFMSETFGLTALFLSTIPICLLAVLLIRYADNVKIDPDKRINYPLHLLTGAAVFCLLSSILASEHDTPALWVAAIILCAAAVFFYRRSKNKIFDLSIMHNRTFATAVVIGLLFIISVYAVDNSMSYYLQMDDRTLVMGTLVITMASLAAFTKGMKPIIQIIASPTIARLSRGKDPNRLSMFGFIFLIVSVLLAVILMESEDGACIIIVCITISALMALANSIFKPMNKSVMMTSVPKEQRNAASSVSNIIDNLGRVVGIFIIVNVLDALGSISTLSLYVCLNIIAVMILTLSVIGLYLCIRRGKKKEGSDAQ